jgi:ABC-type glycerol-3-phosphate transport system substrate-binding protein
MTRTRIAAAFAVLALAGCGGSAATSGASTATPTPGNVAACKAAMTRDYDYALAHPDAPSATRPAACKGVPDATLRKLAAEIMASPG